MEVGEPVEPSEEQRAVLALVQAERSAKRAKQEVRRTIRWAGHCYLGTLTFPAGDPRSSDYGWSRDVVADFFKRWLGGEIGPGGYVVVPERCKRGQWHWHFSFRNRIVTWKLMVAWTHHLARYGLHPPTRYFRTNVRHRSAELCAGYLGKYVTKDFSAGGVPAGRHRFSVGSRTARVEASRVITVGLREDFGPAYELIERASGGRPLGWWVQPDWGCYCISWPSSASP